MPGLIPMDALTTVPEKILCVAVESLSSVFSVEDAVMACWRKFPGHFGLRGYATTAPSEYKVRRWFSDRAGLVLGSRWVDRVGPGRYRVTALGMEHHRALVSWHRAGAEGAKPRHDGRSLRAPEAPLLPSVVSHDPVDGSLVLATPAQVSKVVRQRPAPRRPAAVDLAPATPKERRRARAARAPAKAAREAAPVGVCV